MRGSRDKDPLILVSLITAAHNKTLKLVTSAERVISGVSTLDLYLGYMWFRLQLLVFVMVDLIFGMLDNEFSDVQTCQYRVEHFTAFSHDLGHTSCSVVRYN